MPLWGKLQYRSVAQLVEHANHTRTVVGSRPTSPIEIYICKFTNKFINRPLSINCSDDEIGKLGRFRIFWSKDLVGSSPTLSI